MLFLKKSTDRASAPGGHGHRQGVACVEFAALIPILLILILGIIEVGQFVNVGQWVSNASREGARIAARQTTVDVSQVVTAVTDYLTEIDPAIPTSAIQVTVYNAGNPITGGSLATVATGSAITVQVVVQFDAVRWIKGLTLLNGRSVTNTTVTRRE